jgi:hypothetical protein
MKAILYFVLTILIIFLMLLATVRLWPPGDIDFSGRIDLTDLALLKKEITGVQKLNCFQRVVADINGDKVVDQRDYDLLIELLQE